MSANNTWERVEALFNLALDQPEAVREAWVQEQCGDDAALLEAVQGLLRSEASMGDFLQGPMLNFSGQVFGAYRAVKEIGRGGMSIVYRGERTDGDFDKAVAIKVILVQSHAPIQRGETQILAALEHNHIARLLDAGTTPLGFRYLLMEYVDGVPCTAFAAGLNEKQRLRLFLQMCSGVQYAHRSLVVHRDLKPDNILVTADGTVKLLDFGIAKMLQPDAGAEQTKGVQAYTPNYASPEQILGQPVTTAADVYSLGVLLCELMSGALPRSFTDLPVAEVVAKAQSDDPPVIGFGGDLAVITRKALRRLPEDRYESAGALARDVERYLAGEPIEAREPSWSYRAQKFVGRNRVAVGAAGLAVAGLAIATGVALWQARLAATRFDQVRALARSVMFDLHDAVRPLPGSLAARKIIVDRSLEYLNALAGDANAADEVQLDVARGFMRLADIQGKDLGGESLGRSAEALASTEQAVAVARRVAVRSPRNGTAQTVWLETLDFATTAHTLRGETAKAIARGEEAVGLAKRLSAAEPKSEERQERLASVTKQLAAAYQESGALDKALPLYEQALGYRKLLAAAAPQDDIRQQRMAEAHQWYGTALAVKKEYGKASEQAREALRIDEERYRRDARRARANVAGDAVLLALAERRAGRPNEAIPLLERALTMRKEIAAEAKGSATSAMRVAAAKDRLADTYRAAGRFPEAIRLGEEAVSEMRALLARDPANTVFNREFAFAGTDLAFAYQAAGQKGRACAVAKEMLAFAAGPAKGLRPALNSSLEKTATLVAGCGAAGSVSAVRPLR